MYATAPSEAKQAALKAWGFDPAAFEPDEVVVWPDNRQSVQAFSALRHQWSHGMNGPTGISHAALPELWRRLKVPAGRRDEIFFDLLLMQDAALTAMHEG